MSKSTKKGAEFLCHVKFKNTLPDPVVDYELIDVAPNLALFTGYVPTDLERDHQFEVPASLLRTPLVDFVDLDAFKPQMNELLDVEDEPLLIPFEVLERKRKQAVELAASQQATISTTGTSSSAAVKAPAVQIDSVSRRPEVTWLRRTEYISSEFGKTGKKSLGASQIDSNVTISHNPPPRQQVELETAEDLILAVEEGFEPIPLAQLVHPTNPELKAVGYIPIVPALEAPELGGVQSYTQCLFDVDPKATHGLGDVPVMPDADKSAILRAMSNPSNPSDSFVWYYLRPADTNLSSGVDGEESLLYVRDYDIQRNDKTARSYVLLLDEEESSCRYVPVTTQFHLRKRRLKTTDAPRQPHLLKVTRRR